MVESIEGPADNDNLATSHAQFGFKDDRQRFCTF